jgi:hypothetical protein
VAALVSELGAEPVVDLVRSGLHEKGWSEPFEQRLEQIDPATNIARCLGDDPGGVCARSRCG